jgi:hypothetical protein
MTVPRVYVSKSPSNNFWTSERIYTKRGTSAMLLQAIQFPHVDKYRHDACFDFRRESNKSDALCSKVLKFWMNVINIYILCDKQQHGCQT